MKRLSVVLISIISFCFSSMFIATPSHAADIAQALCEYVAADDKKRMRSFLKTNRVKIRTVFNDIKCNGENLLEFAASRSSVKTGLLIISKLPKKTVSANLEALGKSKPLVDAANDRVSG